MIALRENEPLATSVGVDVTRYLVLATMISAAMAGAAGALYAHYVRIVDPDVFLFIYTVTMVIMVVTGGKGTLAGPIVGGLIFGLLPEVLRAARHQARGAVGDLRRADDPGRLLPARGHRAGRAQLVAGPRRRERRPDRAQPPRPRDERACRRRARGRGPHHPLRRPHRRRRHQLRGAGRARCSPSSAPTAPARPRPSTPSPASSSRPAGDDRAIAARASTASSPTQIAALGVVRTFQKTSVFTGQSVRDNVLIGLHLRSRQRPLAILLGLPSVAREEKELAREAARDPALRRARGARPTSWPRRCPMASCGCSRWPSRWRPSRSCCCSTSRCPA